MSNQPFTLFMAALLAFSSAFCTFAQSAPPVEVQFLGTGAADHEWDRIGDPDVRGSAGTLLAGKILIDAGTTGKENLSRFGIDPSALTALVITHSHSDHFDPAVIADIVAQRAPDAGPLELYCTPEALKRLEAVLPTTAYRGHALSTADEFDIDEFHFTTLPANHLVEDPNEETFHYLIATPQGNILYALDGAWLTCRARALIGKNPLRLIIWDATTEQAGDWRSFEHNDLEMIALMTQALRGTGNIDDRTVSVLDHMARTLWSPQPQAEETARKRGHVMASDGMKMALHSDKVVVTPHQK